MFGNRTVARDERIVAEVNQLYKHAYTILNIGIAVDLYLKLLGPERIPTGLAGFQFAWFELIVFLAVNLTSLFRLWRRGLMDDNAAYAAADTFPLRHYLMESLGAGAGVSLLFGALRLIFSPEQFHGPLVVAVTCGSMFVLTGCCCLLAEYLMFRAARRRRRALDDGEDEQ